ncbi:MAG: iron-containing alcohol dehydrogenase [Anaerolineae bacterium]|nr:iron-containing alcohol dehydrogenase [Anaerolineae bacterium]
MWYFDAPHIVYGEDALTHLETLKGRRALIVTDANMVRLGFAAQVEAALHKAGMETAVFAEVEPDPSLQTARRAAERAHAFAPDWIVGLGGGSCLDAAKACWVLYENPEMDPAAINPVEDLTLRAKARMVAIPTTIGTGSEATWAIVLTDTEAQCKLGLGSRENLPDLAILDPRFVADLPPQIAADTGMDALTHAVEAYTNTWHNDFTDGLALQAVRLIFAHLPAAYRGDAAARERMQVAACLAGMACSNSLFALAHSLGHALGAAFHLPHGRCVGLFLPYTVEFSVRGPEPTRYGDIARALGLPADTEAEGAVNLVEAIRRLAREIGQPLTLHDMGIGEAQLEAHLDLLVDHAEADSQTITSVRVPTTEEFRSLFRCAYAGRPVDF